MKKKLLPAIVVFILIILVLAGLFISSLIKKYTPTKEEKDLSEYYNITSEDQVAIVFNNVVDSENYAKMLNGNIYLDYYYVKKNLNDRFYWDAYENVLLYTTSTDVIMAYADNESYTVTKSSVDFDKAIVKATADSAYIHIDFVKQYTDFEYSICENPNRILITNKWGDITTATVKKDTEVRTKGGIKSPILKHLSEKDKVTILQEDEKWTQVATNDGIIGYVKSKYVKNQETETLTSDFQEETFHHIKKDEQICLAWHQVTAKSANSNISSILSDSKGINVISPTWFYLNDNNGNLANLASTDYVNYCHSQDVEVWALVSNFENTEVDSAYVLTHTSTRQYLVNQIIANALKYNLDGINLDFEALAPDTVGDAYIQFVRELSIKCENNGIILSIDNYVPTDYTMFYNRKEQALFADYIVIMGYDEHFAGSDEAGSVASINWVKEGVNKTLEEVPADQIILAMPFYTRVWSLTPVDENGNTLSLSDVSEESEILYKVTSKAYGMSAAEKLVNSHSAEKVWLDDCGQYYAEYTKDDVIYKVWLEDSSSMEERLKIVNDQQLAGAAFWKLGFEKDSIWDTVIKYIN